MPRPRKPNEHHELVGSWEKNPQRKRAPAPKSTTGIGAPPRYFTADERAIWREIVAQAAAGVLTGADRMIVEMISMTMASIRRREPVTSADRGNLIRMLASLGMTPVDRTRLHITPPEPETESPDPYDEFSGDKRTH